MVYSQSLVLDRTGWYVVETQITRGHAVRFGDGLVQGRCITIGSTLCGCIDANNMKHETK